MIYDKVAIGDAQLTLFVISNSKEMNIDRRRPMVLICPGGAYVGCAERESEPVAIRMLSYGFNAAVIKYTTNSGADKSKTIYPKPQQEVADAVAYIREHSAELNTNPDMIALMGFSAGGHLAASVGCLWNKFNQNGRPNALVLCYPVITSGEYGHKGSFEFLCGESNRELQDSLSVEKLVNVQNPPSFLWHTKGDIWVPYQNSVLFKEALDKLGIRCDLRLFETGGHGLSLANKEVRNEKYWSNDEVCVWPELVRDWLLDLFGVNWY